MDLLIGSSGSGMKVNKRHFLRSVHTFLESTIWNSLKSGALLEINRWGGFTKGISGKFFFLLEKQLV